MRSTWALAPLLFLLATSKAFAQDDAAVTSAFEFASHGVEAFEQDNPRLALEQFSRAYSIVKLPSLAVYMARSHAKLGHYTQAIALYSEAAQLDDGVGDHEVQEQARSQANRERQQLLARMPRLVVQTSGVPIQAVSFQLDGSAASSVELAQGSPVDPGFHRIIAMCSGRMLEQTEMVQDGATKTIVFTFQPAFSTPPKIDTNQPSSTEPGTRALRNATWASFGIGGAALVVWGTTGIWALVEGHDLNKMAGNSQWQVGECGNAPSPSECNDYRRLRTVSTIGFYTGLVGVATGAVLLVATPSVKRRHEASTQLTPWVGLGSAGLDGRF